MIDYSPTGWVALIQEDDLPTPTRITVEKFSDEGDALVVDPRRGQLRTASRMKGFQGLEQCPRWPPVVTPAQPGWRVVGTLESGEEWSDPVVAWAIDDTGYGYPLIPHYDEGSVEAHDVDLKLRDPEGRRETRAEDQATTA
ncbi:MULTISPECIES: hypothetical protein [Amycolatopsis]|uniref:hypothetical protein n=1 Tax=Amycolatopsis TaxID=1813 RepID=UPI0033B302CB